MSDRLGDASVGESLRVVATGLLPAIVRGLFSPRPRAMRLLARTDADGRAAHVLAGLRERHGDQGAKLLGGRIVALWGPEAIREVLDRSAYEFDAGGGAKGTGMAHFQPDALTVSTGEEWEDRRRFAEHALATSETVHPSAGQFLAVVEDEVARLHVSGDLRWSQLIELFDHVTLRVIFGDHARGDQRLSGLLETLMGEANRLVGLDDGDELYELQGGIERYVREAAPGSLMAHVADAPTTVHTRVIQQIPHWMFAMRDTLGANVARALAVIGADEAVETRVREEFEGADLADPAAVTGLAYLSGCLQEAMRLWPTTPLLSRETSEDVQIAGSDVDEGSQVLMVNAFNHRNTVDVPDADRFDPDRWASGEPDYRYNHLSNGTQSCPGGPLVFLLGNAVIGRLLERHDLVLREPDVDLTGEQPHIVDHFALRLAARPRPDA